MNKDTLRQLVNVIALVGALIVNGLANALPLNGKQTGEISDSFAVFFVPAGYVFAIWGIIYIGLIAFGIYQALPSQRENPRLRSLGYWFALSCLANGIWIFLWHYELFPLTLVVMLILLVSLLVIYQRLRIGQAPVSAVERWAVNVPFSIYLGWITVATIANVTDLLEYWGWNGFGISGPVWAVIMLAVASAVAYLMAQTRRDVAYLLVLVWAFIGIAVKQAGTPLVNISAWVATALVVGCVALALLTRRSAGGMAAA